MPQPGQIRPPARVARCLQDLRIPRHLANLSALCSPISASSDCRTPEQKSHSCFPCGSPTLSAQPTCSWPWSWGPCSYSAGVRTGEACYPPGVSGRRGTAAMTANVQAGQAPTTRSNLAKSIDLLTLWLISVDLAANARRERRKGYSVRSDEGDEARCGRCCMTTVRR